MPGRLPGRGFPHRELDSGNSDGGLSLQSYGSRENFAVLSLAEYVLVAHGPSVIGNSSPACALHPCQLFTR